MGTHLVAKGVMPRQMTENINPTSQCVEIIAKALMDDEAEAHRSIDAREREDAFLEKAIMEGDIRVDNNVAAAPNTPMTGSPMPPTVTPPTPRMESMDPAPITHEEVLDENDFHEIINQDQEMYDAIEAVPIGSDDMIGSIVAVVQRHVSEVWSRPRVTKLAHEHG